MLRQITEKARGHNTGVFICFINHTKVFDRVKLKNVVSKIEGEKCVHKHKSDKRPEQQQHQNMCR